MQSITSACYPLISLTALFNITADVGIVTLTERQTDTLLPTTHIMKSVLLSSSFYTGGI